MGGRVVVVYRIPADLDVTVKAAFEAYGVRLLPGDEVVWRTGKRPVVMRELDHRITPHLTRLPVAYVQHDPPKPGHESRPARRRTDRPAYLRLVRDQETA
jgi:hypothetical protein